MNVYEYFIQCEKQIPKSLGIIHELIGFYEE